MNRPKKIIVSVTNDLSNDQRVHKVCCFLQENGYDVLLVGRKLSSSRSLDNRVYKTQRLNLLFTKGALFYAAYNIRLFLFLLFKSCDALLANDLDTLLANYLVAKLKQKKLHYDTHEYFTEVPELVNNPFAKKVWTSIEAFIFPKLSSIYTVNDSIAQCYRALYHKEIKVVRNISSVKQLPVLHKDRVKLGLPIDKKIIVLQGAGINVDRGAEEAVSAMNYLEGYVLLIIGGGDVLPVLKELVAKNRLQEKVIFKGKMPYAEMMQYTACADVGITLDKDTNLNYRYSLPNKLFDYIHAGIPVVASNLIELKKIIATYQIGKIVATHNPQDIAQVIQYVVEHKNSYLTNITIVQQELTWENECKVLRISYSI